MPTPDKRPVDYENVDYELLDTNRMIQELMNRFVYAAFVGVQVPKEAGKAQCLPCFYHTEPPNFGLIGAIDTLKSIVRMKCLGLIRPLPNEDNT